MLFYKTNESFSTIYIYVSHIVTSIPDMYGRVLEQRRAMCVCVIDEKKRQNKLNSGAQNGTKAMKSNDRAKKECV